MIADNTNLDRVDLQENDIKTAGLMALALALKVNENITRLDVDRETKKETVNVHLLKICYAVLSKCIGLSIYHRIQCCLLRKKQ